MSHAGSFLAMCLLAKPVTPKKRAALEAALRLSMKFCSVAPMMVMVMMVVVVVIMMMVRQ